MLALARRFATRQTTKTVRFVAFVNEEPPYFLTEQMGSFVYAERCKTRGDQISAMISLETIGYFSDAGQAAGAHSFDPIVIAAGLVPFLGMILVLLLVRNTAATDQGLVRRI